MGKPHARRPSCGEHEHALGAGAGAHSFSSTSGQPSSSRSRSPPARPAPTRQAMTARAPAAASTSSIGHARCRPCAGTGRSGRAKRSGCLQAACRTPGALHPWVSRRRRTARALDSGCLHMQQGAGGAAPQIQAHTPQTQPETSSADSVSPSRIVATREAPSTAAGLRSLF